jgi:hypothetical protein
VNVDVNQSGRNVESFCVNYLEGLAGRDVSGDRGDLVVFNGDVGNSTPAIPGVDDVSALDEQIVLSLTAGATG